MPRSLSRHANRFHGKRITLEIEPRPLCKHCGMPMKVEARSYPRMVVGLEENYELVTTYYRCGRFPCPGNNEPTVQPDNPCVGRNMDYDFDVLTRVVELRWRHGLSYDKIAETMAREDGVIINHSAVENALRIYEIGCAGEYKQEYIDDIRAFGGVILTIDGMKPLNGERSLYVARDHRTGLTLGSRLLPNQKQETIEAFLQAVQERVKNELGVPILAVVSDALPAQRLAIEQVLPEALHCLCHYHFYNLVLESPKKADSHLVTQVRKALRECHDLRKYKEGRDSGKVKGNDGSFLGSFLNALHALSNWSRKPKDPCFTGLVLWKRLNDLAAIAREASDLAGTGRFTTDEEKVIQRVSDLLERVIDEHGSLAADLERVRAWLQDLQEVLADDDPTARESLESLRKVRDKATRRARADDVGPMEKDFCVAFVKFVNTKGDLLFNFKDVDGAPRTNNSHELFYKQLKHLLRKVIGFAAASAFLIGHGERIVYVKRDDPPERIREIFMKVNFDEARKIIALERKPRDMMMYVMHDSARWEERMQDLLVRLHGSKER